MDRCAGVIAPGHQRHVAILHGDCLIKLAVIGINPLEGKALRRVEPVIIGFLQGRFMGQVVLVVLVGRIGRGVPGRRQDLHHQQIFRHFPFRQDVGDMARVGALAPGFLHKDIRHNHARRKFSLARGGTHGQHQIFGCLHRPDHGGRHIDGPGPALKG